MKFYFSKFNISLLFVCSLCYLTTNALASNDEEAKKTIIGIWKTTLEEKGTELILILDFQATESDSLACTLHVPEMGGNMPFGKFILNGDKLTLPGFEASLDVENQKITGTFSAFGPEMKLTLEKISKIPEFNNESPIKEIDWAFKSDGAIWSSPTISKGRIIFGNDEGNLYSVKIDDKSVAWKIKCSAAIRSKATIIDGNICFTSDDGYLYLVDFETGKSKWKVNIGNDTSPRIKLAKDDHTYDYICSSASVSEGRIFIGSMDSCIYAINANNGDVLWKHKTGGRIRSTPLVNEGAVYVGSWDHFMYSFKASNGELIWKYDAGRSIQSSPIAIDNKLIFGSRASSVFALDIASGEELWKTSFWGSWVESSPVLYGGNVYVGSSDYRKICAINPDNGMVIMSTRLEGWAWPTPAVSDKYIYSGCIGTLYYTENMHGSFYAFDRLTGKAVWQVKAEDDPNTFAYGFASSPTLWDGWVFFGGLDGNMYGVKEK